MCHLKQLLLLVHLIHFLYFADCVAVIARLFALCCSNFWQSGQYWISLRQVRWNEWEHPSNKTHSVSLVTIQSGMSHTLSGSGFGSLQYPKGSTFGLTGSGKTIVGKTTLKVFPLPLNSALPWFWAILMNMCESMSAHLIFRYLSCFCLKVKLDGGVKYDLSVHWAAFAWNGAFAFCCNCSTVSLSLVFDLMILRAFSTGYSSNINRNKRSMKYKSGLWIPQYVHIASTQEELCHNDVAQETWIWPIFLSLHWTIPKIYCCKL